MARRLGRLAAASTAAVALVAGACTSDPNEAAGTASTTGLTEDTIRIGVIGADFGQLSEIGLAPDLGDQEVTVQAFVDEINEDGGIGGRQIELRQTLIDGAGGRDAGQAACLEMTEEFGAFAVIVAPAVPRDVARCTAVTNRTLTIAATGFDQALYEEAGGLLFSAGSVTSMSTDRQYAGWAQIMHDEGFLDGRTIGVVTSENTPEFVAAAKDALVPTLEGLGYEVPANVVLPCPELDPDCEQHEAAVQQMKDARVDFVFMAAANIAGPDGSLSADKHDAGDHLFLCDYRAEARECVQRPGEPIEIAR